MIASTRASASRVATSIAPPIVPRRYLPHLTRRDVRRPIPLRAADDVDFSMQCFSPLTRIRRFVGLRPGDSFKQVATLVDVDCPIPLANEVLIRVTHAGINGGCETFRSRAEYAFAKNKTAGEFSMGAEGCGIVAAVGDAVTTLSVGMAVAFNGAAAFSEYVVAAPRLCTRVPLPSPEAVAVALSGVTAAVALEESAGIKSGETVLVTAASGGTGHFAVQLAKLAGCHVVATCGSDNKAEALLTLGADRVINYKTEDVAAVLSSEYPKGIDVVYEGVGGALRHAALANLAEGGRFLQVGYISEYPHAVPSPQPQHQPQHMHRDSTSGTAAAVAGGGGGGGGIDDLPSAAALFWGGQDVIWGSKKIIGAIWPKDPRGIVRARRRVFKLFLDGTLKVWIDRSRVFKGIESIPDAVEHMLQGQHVGKVVVEL